MSEQKIKVGITLGDINGIGCETVIKVFLDNRMLEMCTPVIYGPSKAMSFYKKEIDGAGGFFYNMVANAAEARHRKINAVNCDIGDIKIEPGTATAEAGAAAVTALRWAVDDLKKRNIDVLATAPINKENVQGEEFPFTGHTEFFASDCGTEPLMLLASEVLKVGLVTIHISVNEISGSLDCSRIVGCIKKLRASLISDFGIVEPRIAVLALNPHAGDGGLLGDEEINIIKPAIIEAYKQGILAFGPFAADGFFALARYKKYDAVLAMYHDQGLAPFKALTPEGVNFTAGLPYVRTSPDHGVAYDIAGKGIADPASMREAIFMAIDIYNNRSTYREMTANPLKHYEREKGADVSVRDLLPDHDEI